MNKPLNIRKNEIMSASLVHKKAFEFFEKALRINQNVGIEQFLIKIPINRNGTMVINMMSSELQSDKFIELYTVNNKTYKTYSEHRELLLWSYHKHLDEYESVVTEESIKQYFIPINELTSVSVHIDETLDEENDEEDEFNLGNSNLSIKDEENAQQNLFSEQKEFKEKPAPSSKQPLQDAYLMHLTARDLFSIIHCKPISNKPWINELVTQNK